MKAYLVLEPDESDYSCYGYVVADNAREAKKIAWADHPDTLASFDGEYIRMRVKLARKANIEGLNKGWLDCSKDALKRHVFGGWVEDDCDKCGKEERLELHGVRALCSECAEGAE